MSTDGEPQAARSEPGDGSLIDAAHGVLRGALHVAEASLALLRAELKLARSSAIAIIWLSFTLIFLGAGAWLALTAAIAAGIFQLTGNLFAGIGFVALGNMAGMALVIRSMRRCWRDLSLPQTRALLANPSTSRIPELSPAAPENSA